MTAEAAAAMLGTSTTILSLWEKRFGYPSPVRAADGQWLYADDEMISLRDALNRELSIASAITSTRQAHSDRCAHGPLGTPHHSPQEAR
jgi:MerR HTH family regulatory protein